MAKILVTGATGNTGSLIVTLLLDKGADVRALVRDEDKAKGLRDAGAEIVVGDLDDPSTLGAAFDGVDKVYLVTWNGPTGEQQRKNAIAAAQASGSPHVVVGGALGIPSRITNGITAANDALKDSGLPWTILQPTFFMQNLMGAKQTIAEQDAIYFDLADGKLPMIDVRDIADAAVAVLTTDGHRGKTYNLTGPAAISMQDVAKAFSDGLGRPITYTAVPTAAAKDALMSMGYPEWTADGFGELMAGFADNWAADKVSPDVERLTGHAPRSIDTFVRDFKGFFAS
jgi:uncharacterized protein YbjT (DUF2867 family)